MLMYKDFDSMDGKNDFKDKQISFPALPENVFIIYEGGRLAIYVDDKLLFEKSDAGTDFTVTIDRERY